MGSEKEFDRDYKLQLMSECSPQDYGSICDPVFLPYVSTLHLHKRLSANFPEIFQNQIHCQSADFGELGFHGK